MKIEKLRPQADPVDLSEDEFMLNPEKKEDKIGGVEQVSFNVLISEEFKRRAVKRPVDVITHMLSVLPSRTVMVLY